MRSRGGAGWWCWRGGGRDLGAGPAGVGAIALRRLPDSPVKPGIYQLWLPAAATSPRWIRRRPRWSAARPRRWAAAGARAGARGAGDPRSADPAHGLPRRLRGGVPGAARRALGLARERTLRDLAGVDQVHDARHPAGYADGRCAWLHLQDLALPGVGEEPVLRTARARKAHGLPVELRDGRDAAGERAWRPRPWTGRPSAPASRTGRAACGWCAGCWP
ncbi:MAG: hypothetical protein R3F43_24735 [bacterium]